MFAYFFLLTTTALAGFMSYRNVLRKILFFVPTLLIVGLKYEVGFDWHVYSAQFETFRHLSPQHFMGNFFGYVAIYQHEPFFVLISYIGAKTLGTFEVFYFILFLFFIYSTARLGKVLEANYVAAFFIIHLFLLFSLEFSTLRQMVALSVLNFGIAIFLEGKTGRGLILILISPFLQGSTAIFVLLFFMPQSTRRLTRIVLALSIFGIILINAVGVGTFLNYFSGILPGFLGEKLTYYAEVREFGLDLREAIFAITLYSLLGYFLFLNRKNPNDAINLLSKFLLFVIAVAFASFTITTIRNRMLYEIVIIASLLLFSGQTLKPMFIKPAVISLGLCFFAVSLAQTASFMYVPYQNYLWFQIWDLESDGPDRQSLLRAIIRENM